MRACSELGSLGLYFVNIPLTSVQLSSITHLSWVWSITIYINQEIDKQIRVAAVEDDKFYGEYAEEAFRLFLDKRRKEKRGSSNS